jgi:predicted small metal-binding protein
VETTITVRCACGWETSGSEDVVVEATVEHGRRLHNMAATRDQVLAMAIQAVATDETSDERVGSTD